MRYSHRWQRALASLIGGLLLVASFPPYDLVWLAPPALALLTTAWHGARIRDGAWLGLIAGLAFFGADHVLFGTDMPFDPEKGTGFIRETIEAMTRMRATDEDKAKIYDGNARRLLRLRLK